MPEMSCGYIVKIGNGTELWIKIADLVILEDKLEEESGMIIGSSL